MELKVYAFRCPDCGYYSGGLLAGTPDMDQTLTDVNDEFADYKIFRCPAESGFRAVDVLSPDFDGKCAADGAELVEVQDIERLRCPRCGGQRIMAEEAKPLSEAAASE